MLLQPVRASIGFNIRHAVHTTARTGLSCALAAGFAITALAQDAYPERPVKVIVALPAGGSADMIARIVGQKLATELKQPFVVDNRAGASGQIGTPAVARSAPDGYTLMVSPASFLTTNKSIFKSLPYDPEADFAPISKLVNQPMVLVVKDKQKFPSVAAVVAAAKAAPGKLTFASGSSITLSAAHRPRCCMCPTREVHRPSTTRWPAMWTCCSPCCPKPCPISRPANCTPWA